jgi:hypothetical protein
MVQRLQGYMRDVLSSRHASLRACASFLTGSAWCSATSLQTCSPGCGPQPC